MKQCLKCRKKKDVSEFSKKTETKDGLQNWCKTCKSKYCKSYYKTTNLKDKLRVSNASRRQRVKEEVQSYKASKGCKYCPEQEPCCLQFHHPSDDKLDNVANLLDNSGSSLWTEIAKCDVVCANCHFKLHAGLIHHAE